MNRLACTLVASLVIACGGAPPPVSEGAAPSVAPDPTHFSADRFEASLRELVVFGARPAGSAALSRVHEWALANAPATRPDAIVALSAALDSGDAGDDLEAASSGAALVLEVARMLAARGEPVRVAFTGSAENPPSLAGAGVAVFVQRACAVPQRRDLLSHRVLRERFFRIAGVEAELYEQSAAPHAVLVAAGAARVVALDGPRAPGAECAPAGFGDALARFVTDATALLARGHEK